MIVKERKPSSSSATRRRACSLAATTHSDARSSSSAAATSVASWVSWPTCGRRASRSARVPRCTFRWRRVAANPTALSSCIRAAIRTMRCRRSGLSSHRCCRRQPLRQIARLDDLVAAQTAERRLNMLMFSLFGLLGLVISAVGLFGVIAYLVSQQTRDIGIRMALGATRSRVVAGVFGHAGAARGRRTGRRRSRRMVAVEPGRSIPVRPRPHGTLVPMRSR